MKGRRLVLLQCGCLIMLFATWSARAAAPAYKLGDNDIIRMAQAGMDARTIIDEIEASKTNFQVSPDDLINLKENGVAGAVIRKMIAVGPPRPTPDSGTRGAASDKTLAQFSGSTVLAKYVAGTDRKGENTLNKLGCLTWTWNGKAGSLVFLSYGGSSHDVYRAGWFVTHLLDPSWAKGGGRCKAALNKARNDTDASSDSSKMEIPFDQIKVLSNGRVTAIGQPNAGAIQSLLAIAGVGGLISSLASSKTAASTKIWLGAGAGTVALVAAGVYLNRRTNNYITIIYKKDSGSKKSAENPDEKLVIQTKVTTRKAECGFNCGQTTGNYFPTGSEKTVTTRVPKPAETPGKCQGGCKIAVFQIIDPHDWWNTTMFLQARTGLPVVPEGSIFGGAGGGSTPAPAKSK